MHSESNGHPGPPARPRVIPFPEDRLPPQSIEAEQGVLGSILLDESILPDVLEILPGPAPFYRAAHQAIYAAILEVYQRGDGIDTISVGEELVRSGAVEVTGKLDFLKPVLDGVDHIGNALYYAQVVREKALARELVRVANEVLAAGYSHRLRGDELAELAERELFGVLERSAVGRTTTLAAAADEVLRRMAQRREGGDVGLPTGFADLDSVLDGMHPGQLVLVAARPSAGKSSFAINVCEHLAGRGVAGLLVSLEMSAPEVAERFLSARSRVPATRMRDPARLDGDGLRRVILARGDCDVTPVLIDDTPARTMAQILANGRRSVRRDGVRFVVVDYLQLIDPGESSRDASRQEQVAEISRRLKAMARQLRVPVLALSQLNRNAEQRTDRRPRLADLRESGAIEQDADVVLLLHRPELYDASDSPGLAEVIVAKNRNGPTRTVKLTFLKELMAFANHAPDEFAPLPPADDVPLPADEF